MRHTMSTSSTERFTGKAESYQKARPSYPPSLIPCIKQHMLLTRNSVIADVGSGTGILSELFLRNGYTVYGVEPNESMRRTAEYQLSNYTCFVSITGSAEQSGLHDKSCDLITAGQSFHWFHPRFSKKEFQRILKPSGKVALIWNTLAETQLVLDYQSLLQENNPDYKDDGYKRTNPEDIEAFLGENHIHETLINQQTLTRNEFLHRVLSSSYAPPASDTRFLTQLNRIFDAHQRGDMVVLQYQTEVHMGSVF